MAMEQQAPLIVVVDDDPTYIDLLCDFLADEGYQALCCLSDEDAFTVIVEKRPDLVILDMRMEQPDSGWTVLEMLRLGSRTRDIPVVLCSGDVQFLREKEQLLRTLHCALLEKPFTLTQLLQKVDEAINSMPK